MEYRRKGVPVTCTYWRNASCFKGERCTFVHGFICRDDGVCSDPSCNKSHFKQRDPCTYMKVNSRNGSRPRHRSRSRSPYHQRSRSPFSGRRGRRGSFSPRQSMSPRHSYSPRRSYSRSPRRSNSARRSYSPYKKTIKSRSRSGSLRRSRTPAQSPREDRSQKHRSSMGGKNNGDEYGDQETLYKEEGFSKKESKPKFKPIGGSPKPVAPPKEMPEEPSTSGRISPSARALEIIKSLPKNLLASKDGGSVERRSKDDAAEHALFREAFLKALSESSSTEPKGGLPPVKKCGTIPANAESLARPFQEKLMGMEAPSSVADDMWNDAVRSRPKTEVNADASSWEIETPYVGRNSRGEAKMSKNAMLPPLAAPEEDTDKKHRKKRRHKSSSSSSSDGEEEAAEGEQEEMDVEAEESALERKKKILSKVWTLMEQKKRLQTQRDEVVLGHKGDGKSLASLLKENSALSSEIDRQIFVMNQMVQSINDRLGMSRTEAQQQEFFFQPSMYKEGKACPPPARKSLNKAISKFLKPPTGDDPAPTPPASMTPPKRSKKSKSPKKEAKAKKEKSPSRKKESKKEGKTKSKAKMADLGGEYMPSPALKPNVQYVDQGMHWCRLCDIFLDTIQQYVDHLESGRHVEKAKKDSKKWLPKAPKKPKEQVDPNAPVITIPLQGLEFVHSLAAFYCSLCNDFIKSKSEARLHAESKLHVSKYKDHLSRNPMYETSYVRDKMAAFARFSLKCERERESAGSSVVKQEEEEFFRKGTLAIGGSPSVKSERPNDDEMSSQGGESTKSSSSSEEEAASPATESFSSYLNGPDAAASIRVSSRGARERHTPTYEESLEEREPQYEESKLEALKRKVSEGDGDGETDAPPPTLRLKRYSNVIIGKMPFLKRPRPTPSSNAREEESETPSGATDAEERIRQFLSEGASQREESPSTPSLSLPGSVPRNVEYITAVAVDEDATTFTRKIGPTFDSAIEAPDDMEMGSGGSGSDSNDIPMKKKLPEVPLELPPAPVTIFAPPIFSAPPMISMPPISAPPPPSAELMEIPVPLIPQHISTGLPLDVDLSSPRLSQLSAAAVMYKEGVAAPYPPPLPPPIPPPSSFMQMPPAPPMLFPPPFPPPVSMPMQINTMRTQEDSLDPPPPGTEIGAVLEAGCEATQDAYVDAGDSNDSFLCQKTPPPPGTEDEPMSVLPAPIREMVESNSFAVTMQPYTAAAEEDDCTDDFDDDDLMCIAEAAAAEQINVKEQTLVQKEEIREQEETSVLEVQEDDAQKQQELEQKELEETAQRQDTEVKVLEEQTRQQELEEQTKQELEEQAKQELEDQTRQQELDEQTRQQELIIQEQELIIQEQEVEIQQEIEIQDQEIEIQDQEIEIIHEEVETIHERVETIREEVEGIQEETLGDERDTEPEVIDLEDQSRDTEECSEVQEIKSVSSSSEENSQESFDKSQESSDKSQESLDNSSPEEDSLAQEGLDLLECADED